jgi:hypothetical protein
VRHFISADFSWLRVYEIYTELFGKNNVLVLPQEMLLNDIHEYVERLSIFVGSELMFNARPDKMENQSPDLIVFKSKEEEKRFKAFVLSINSESNSKLNNRLSGEILKRYGYCECGSTITISRHIGFETNSKIEIRNDKLKKLKLYFDRMRFFDFTFILIKFLYKFIKNKIKLRLLIRAYYRISVLFESLQGIDFSKVESLDDLGLKRKKSNRYESTKKIEIERWLEYIPKDIEYNAIDFGSGKGTVLVVLDKLKNFNKIYGIEISENLNLIARKNLRKKHVTSVSLLGIDAVEIPERIIDECNFFFFYNPFPYSVFEIVFDKIESSFQRNNRDAVIMYFNPVHGDIIERSKYFVNTYRLNNPLSTADTYIYRSIVAFEDR